MPSLGLEDEDLPYEQRLLKEPQNAAIWVQYIKSRQGRKDPDVGHRVLSLYSRCLRHLPDQKDIWMAYIEELLSAGKFRAAAAVYVQATLQFPDDLGLWLEFLRFLTGHIGSLGVSKVRQEFNRSLQTLPTSEHAAVWVQFLKFAEAVGGPTQFVVNARYPEFWTNAVSLGGFDAAADGSLPTIQTCLNNLFATADSPAQVDKLWELFQQLVGDAKYASKLDRPELDLYVDMFESLTSVASAATDRNAQELYKTMRSKFPGQMAVAVVKMAQYRIERKDYTGTTSMFEEGLAECPTLKDFTVIYDSYTEFVDSRLDTITQALDKDPDNKTLESEADELYKQYESLLSRRQYLINDIYLRHDPNDVQAWLNRAALFDPFKDAEELTKLYAAAILKIEQSKVSIKGLLPQLWEQYVDILSQNGGDWRKAYDAATKVPFKNVSDLEDIWSAWIAREGSLEESISLARKALTLPKNFSGPVKYKDEDLSPQVRIHKSSKIWSLLIDLVKSAGDEEAACNVYDQVLSLKIATPQTIIDYAAFLLEHGKPERALQVYERGVSLFKQPTSYEIWEVYLGTVLKLQTKLEIRTEHIRDLFEESLEGCPPDLAKELYLKYAQFEETVGFKPRALTIISKAIDSAEAARDKAELYRLLLSKTRSIKGESAVTPIYQKALESLPVSVPGFLDDIAAGFVSSEASQKRYKRCREILQYTATLVMQYGKTQDMRDRVWDLYKQFELDNGTESTYKDLLRFKRQLESTSRPIIRDEIAAAGENGVDFVHSKRQKTKAAAAKAKAADAGTQRQANEDQIELDLDDLV